MAGKYHFANVTLLVTHYNRSKSLERLLQSFRELECSFGDIVISDDGSKREHQDYIKQLQNTYTFTLVNTPVNRGLGNNINKGQDAVKTPFTLYIQEDFVPKAIFPEHFADALQFMEEDKGLDIARFYAYFKYPYLKPYGKGFFEMKFHSSPLYSNHLKFYFYSDHPHLRRSNFFQKFGRYPEGLKGDITEYRMALNFLYHHARGIFYNEFTSLIDQANSSAEPSTMNRAGWRESRNIFFLAIRAAYLKVKLLKWTRDLVSKKYMNRP
ncbi:MAG TPA: glycosyltransferase [Chitinophagaceae bacterium]|nr:glycosyltransferase [Chitinophagaceae bacterium]